MFDIYWWVEISYLACLIFFGLFFLAGFIRYLIGSHGKTRIVPSDATTRFAILIPARDESAVIENNLKSIEKNNYPKNLYKIYLIVEREDDPTVEIAKKYDNTEIFYRVNLNNVGKSYALDECINYIYKNDDNYDTFLIMDADNLISSNFIQRMNDAYNSGYDIACGKRENKDWNASITCGCSCLTFTIINSIQNKPKTYYGMNVTITGTGYYIGCNVLREYSGWPFHTLTEDYELTTYSFVHGLKTGYVEDALFYDEQPLMLRQSIVQRTRWIQGYFNVRKKYKKEKKEYLKKHKESSNVWLQFIGGFPCILIVLVTFIYLVWSIIVSCYAGYLHDVDLVWLHLTRVLYLLMAIYLAFTVFTCYLMYIDRKTMKIKFWNRILVILFHPIFMFTYINSAIRCLFVRDKWERIEHTINMNSDDTE